MNDPLILSLVALLSLTTGVWFAIRCCADAQLSSEAKPWWHKALFLAEQRTNYDYFCKQMYQKEKARRTNQHPH